MTNNGEEGYEGYDLSDMDDPRHPINCRHVEVAIEADDAEGASEVRCAGCGWLWPLDDAPAELVARAVVLMLGTDTEQAAATLWTIRDVPRVRSIEVVDLLAQAVAIDRYRDAE